jgi:hypothetical protein
MSYVFVVIGEERPLVSHSAPQLFETPCKITMIIAATRMHRALVDFASGSSDMYGTLYFLLFGRFSEADVVLGHMKRSK